MASQAYSTKEVAQMTGFSVRQLDYWARQSIVIPSVREASGSGTRRLYALEDLIQLRFILQLKRLGHSTQSIRKAVITLRDVMNDPNPLKSAVLFHDKHRILALCKTRSGEQILLDALSSSGQQVMRIVLETLVEETNKVVRKAYREQAVERVV